MVRKLIYAFVIFLCKVNFCNVFICSARTIPPAKSFTVQAIRLKACQIQNLLSFTFCTKRKIGEHAIIHFGECHTLDSFLDYRSLSSFSISAVNLMQSSRALSTLKKKTFTSFCLSIFEKKTKTGMVEYVNGSVK